MKTNNRIFVRKIALAGILTALTVVMSLIKFNFMGASINLTLPAVVIGLALAGPYVGAWLTVIPNILAFSEAGIFISANPIAAVATLLLKGILAGLVGGWVYKLVSRKSPTGAAFCASIVTPIVNSGVFLLGCYIFIWDTLVHTAQTAGYGVGMLVFGLVGLNFAIELILSIVLCPAILRIIQFGKQKFSLQ